MLPNPYAEYANDSYIMEMQPQVQEILYNRIRYYFRLICLLFSMLKSQNSYVRVPTYEFLTTLLFFFNAGHLRYSFFPKLTSESHFFKISFMKIRQKIQKWI